MSDPGQLWSGIAAARAAAGNTDPTFDTLTVTGPSTLTTLSITGDDTVTALEVAGPVVFDLPTSDPGLENQLWNDSLTAAVSAGA